MRIIFIFFLCVSLNAQEIIWTHNSPIIRTFSSPRTTDLNNDGIKDIILGGGVEGFPTPYGVNAIDGDNGETLWTVTTRNEMFTSPQFYDFDNDNIDDIVIGGRDAELRLISGATGQVIWEFWDNEDLNPNDFGWYNFYTSQIIDDLNNDGLPEILTSNGGDHSLDFSELNRPPGHLMIIDGLSGEAYKTAVVPDSNETYLSPIIHDLNGDSEMSIIFGTGGEGISGNLWIVSLDELINEDISNATPLLNNSSLGHIAPPSVGDLNNDGVLDIVTQGFDGKVTAIDGFTYSMLWQYELPNTESSASPIIGKFTPTDSNLDVFATIYAGGMSSYSDYYQVLIDGESGQSLWNDSLGMINFCSPIAFDSNLDNKDEVLISVINHNGIHFENELILIDFTNEETSTINTIPGGNIASTPNICDLDSDGFLDIIFSVQGDSIDPFGSGSFFEIGTNTSRLSTNFILPEKEVAWASYMGSQYDGSYSAGCDSDLGLFAFPSDVCPGENNGLINLLVTGGTPPYSYLWSNGETSEDLEDLGPGDYLVTVTDSNGNCDVVSRTVNEYNTISFFETESCAGQNDAFVYFNSSGCDCNTSFCQFIWELNGDTIAIGDGSTAEETYKYLFNVSSGTYTATIIHPDGCEVQEEIIVPDATMIEDFTIQNECSNNNDGSITLNISDEDLQIQNYLWNTGDTTQNLYNLSSGSYSVVISDTTCIDTLSFEIESITNNVNFMESFVEFGSPSFVDAGETYNLNLQGVNCQTDLLLWIETPPSEIDISIDGGTSGELESGNCNFDVCYLVSESFEFQGWTQLNFVFTNTGNYQISSSSNLCENFTDNIEMVIADDCDNTSLDEYLDYKIYIDNKQLVLENLDDSKICLYDNIAKKIFETKITSEISTIQVDKFDTGFYTIHIIKDNTSRHEQIYIN